MVAFQTSSRLVVTAAIAALSFGSHVAAFCNVYPGPSHQSLGEFQLKGADKGQHNDRFVLDSSVATMHSPLNNDNSFEVSLNPTPRIVSHNLPGKSPVDGYWLVTVYGDGGVDLLSYTISHFESCDVEWTSKAQAVFANYVGIRLSNLF